MSRLIDADLLKKNIAKWLGGGDPQETVMVSVDDIAVSVITEIEEQPTAYDVEKVVEEQNKGWIPCKDRLPESNKPVLCWVKSTTIASGETFIIGSCSNKFWFLQTYEIGHHHFPVKDYEVVAWQALPESYKEGEEEC